MSAHKVSNIQFAVDRNDRLVKGTHVQIAQRCLDRMLGPDTFRTLTAAGGTRWKVILPVAWYELDILNGAFAAAADRLGVSIHDLATEIACENARTDLRGVYKIFFKMLSVRTILGQLPRLWRSYVHFGECVPITSEPGHYVAEGQGMFEEYLAWTSGCCRGFITTAVEMAGGRDIHAKIVPLTPLGGRARFKFDLTYKE